MILAISYVLREFSSLKVVQYAFYGIRAGVLALIAKAWWTMYKKSPKNIVSYIIAVASFLIVAIFDINVLYVIIGCAVVGLISSIIVSRRAKQ